jgi:hypothetical protein
VIRIDASKVTQVRIDGAWTSIKPGSLAFDVLTLANGAAPSDEFQTPASLGYTFVESTGGLVVSGPVSAITALRSK